MGISSIVILLTQEENFTCRRKALDREGRVPQDLAASGGLGMQGGVVESAASTLFLSYMAA